MSYLLEVIGFNISSCEIAQEEGAGRIELCTSPGDGGTTPPYSLIKSARKKLNIPLYVMIRPRGGDFLYSDDEYEMMKEDIRICKQLGADGVVLGILDELGNIDVRRCSGLVELAYPMGVTFHRAFERVRDYRQALSDVIHTGCKRILTSGLRPRAVDGLATLKELITLADHQIIIMPGSGVNAYNIEQIVRETGATEVHSSASMSYKSQMKFENPDMNEALEFIGANGDAVREMSEKLRKMERLKA